MRECRKTNNFSYLGGLIEEAQVMANRMEARIHTVHDLERLEKRTKEMRTELKKNDKSEYGD
jgi:hypothetical protein